MKAKRIITITVTALAALMVIASSIMKLTGSAQVVDTLTRAGVGQYISMLGIMELVFAILFLVPKTMKPGFILLSCYFAGAMATELSHNGPVMNAVIPMVLIWVSAFLREPNLFLPARPATGSLAA